MKLLTRLRKSRESRYDQFAPELSETDNEHLESIGVGAATVDDIIRLNLEHINLQEQRLSTRFVF
ncbi:hypothetical protein [Methylotenera versatilis]|uniref:hypothetical protein n=1 Tax=Methylotenera versatilis TaxID=1055487 RepID=UPI000646BBC2|nr:hypothetical protein [Methylotenera versatilis]